MKSFCLIWVQENNGLYKFTQSVTSTTNLATLQTITMDAMANMTEVTGTKGLNS